MKRQIARAVELYSAKGVSEATRRIVVAAWRTLRSEIKRLRSRSTTIPITYLGETQPTRWMVDSSRAKTSYHFKGGNNGVRIKSSAKDQHVYLVCKGTGADMRRLSSGAGFSVVPGANYEFAFQIRGSGIRVYLVVIEFSAHGHRLADTRVAAGSPVTVALNPNTRRVLLALRVSGAGEATLSQLTVAAHKGDRQLSARISSDPRDFTGSASTAAGRTLHGVLCDLALTLPKSNGSRFGDPLPKRVGIVTDIYMYNFYKDAFVECIYISPDDIGQIDDLKLDAFLYVSCWAGINNDEWRGIHYREPTAKAMNAILAYCKEKHITTIFQSIEDPSNFEHFLPLARAFDVVFTSDSDSIDRYKQELGHERVFYAEYGVNPRLHNPIGSRRSNLNAAFFAGSWAARYPERCEDMRTIFDTINSSGGELIIADRNENTTSEELRYPIEYRPNLIPPFEHELLQSVHKLFRYNLNFNSIKSSPTMCAMRVYEMQAMGVGIISNYARSVFNRFPEIAIIPALQSLETEFVRPSADKTNDEYEAAMTCVRNVMTARTNIDIARSVLAAAGFTDLPERSKPIVAVLYQAEEPTVCDQRDVEAIFVDSQKVRTPAAWSKFTRDYSIDFFTWHDPADEWEAGHLIDLINGFKYTDSHYVTRAAWYSLQGFVDGPQHEYVDVMPGKARTLFCASVHSPAEFAGLGLHQATYLANGYSIDPFQLNYRRHLASTGSSGLLAEPVLSVIVPVHNNGRFLLNKAFPSLRRNQNWPLMEIILVDDGSTDLLTLQIEEDLAARFQNVRLHRTNDTASGSASRPRNIGIQLARAELVSFLDPDNEISAGGYDRLLEIKQELENDGQNVDFVSGYHLKVAQRAQSVGKHTSESAYVVDDLLSEFFGNGKFPVIPTQPAVIKRSLFKSEHLRFVEGAAGQDTLFGWELLCQASSGAFTSDVFLVYYPERADSITNEIGRSYFEKHLKLEVAQLEMLKRNGLLESYKENHFQQFFDGWYLKKMEYVENSLERDQCERILSEISSLYLKETN